MNTFLLHSEVQDFINANLKTDIPGLILKGSPFTELKIQELAEQIASKSKCRLKLPSWYATEGIYYPKPINIEQSSSEITAQYKSALVQGKNMADLSGGFGVDSYYFSKQFDRLTHCEIDPELSAIAAHNFHIFGLDQVNCLPVDGITFLQKTTDTFDWLYMDPSRRSDLKGKVFLLEDCVPNVVKYMDLLLSKTKHLMIKLSPLLDIHAAVNRLKFIREIHVIAHLNEVKELLIIIEKGYKGTPRISTVNFNKEDVDHFEADYPSSAIAGYSFPKTYLYEPNSAILKAGLFNEVSRQLNVFKLHVNSHLYTSDELLLFPGRRFSITGAFKYNPKVIKKSFPVKKANITTRNFHETVAQIRKRTGIKEGGADYLFCTTDLDNQALVIHCKKV